MFSKFPDSSTSCPACNSFRKTLAFRPYRMKKFRPASRGRGIIAGGHVRALLAAAGVNDVLAKVQRLEYDPNRSTRLVLLHYAGGKKRYILAPRGLNVGDTIILRKMAIKRILRRKVYIRDIQGRCPTCGKPVYDVINRFGLSGVKKMAEANKAFAHFAW